MSILVCGDAMVDRYLWGDVKRISPEAPVPVACIERIEERAGGAANVVNNVRALGVECAGIFSPSEAPLVKIRVIGRSQQMLRIDFDSPQEPVEEEKFKEALPPCTIVIFSDYGKGSLSNIPFLIQDAKQAGKTVLVDPKGHDYERYRGADFLKPNLEEMKELVGGWKSEEILKEKAHKFIAHMSLKGLLLTKAAAGMTLYTLQGDCNVPTQAQEVYDVSGAGDTTIAAFAVALSMGCTWSAATHHANKAAGIVVGRFGTAVATKEEVFGL